MLGLLTSISCFFFLLQMASMNKERLLSDRSRNPSEIDSDDIRSSICTDILRKLVTCPSCKTPFCSSWAAKRFETNPNKCQITSENYIKRSCSPFVLKRLAMGISFCMISFSRQTISRRDSVKFIFGSKYTPVI
jgi:hypothetical protein